MNTAKIDLHLHLDGSLDLPWAYQTALKRKCIPEDWSFEQYYNFVYFNDYPTREERMKKFDIPISIMQTKEDLYQSIYKLIETLNEKEMVYAEIRFAPQQHCQLGLTQYEVCEAVLAGMHRANLDFLNVKTGLILCMMHKGKNAACNMKENLETIEVAKRFLNQGVVGLDLAGYENTGPFMDYAPLFQLAQHYDIPYTIHAGEMGEGIHVEEAILMGAKRIGHGINCIQNEKWLALVKEKQIPLEVCVSSNVGDQRNYAAHPITQLLKEGVKCTINCDNMMFSKTDLANEHSQLRKIGITQETLKQCTLNAVEAAFCDDETKNWIKARLNFDAEL